MIGVAKLRVQCTCRQTGVVGDFLEDVLTGQTVTPIFDNLVAFYNWIPSHGWREATQEWPKKYPLGVFERILD